MRTSDSNPCLEDSDAVRDCLKLRIEEFALLTGLDRGMVTVTTHEGLISKVELQYLVNVTEDDGQLDRNDQSAVHFNRRHVADFVRSQLEQLVLASVGRFGNVEARISNSRVTDLGMFARYKYHPGNHTADVRATTHGQFASASFDSAS